MIYDLKEAEAKARDLIDELDATPIYCIGVELWKHSNCDRLVTLKLSLFDKWGRCHTVSAPDIDSAIILMRVESKGKGINAGGDPIVVQDGYHDEGC